MNFTWAWGGSDIIFVTGMKVNWGGEECTALQMLWVGVQHGAVGDPCYRHKKMFERRMWFCNSLEAFKYVSTNGRSSSSHLSLIFIVSSWTRMQCIFADGSPSRRLRLGGRWSLASCYTQSQWYKLRPKCEVYGSQHNADSHGNVQALMKHNNFLCLHHFVFSQWTKYFQEPSSLTWQPAEDTQRVGAIQTAG